jgi:lipopolysaccharide transport system ATP-binding protein
MYLRLAFAVAAHLEPEILLVDEVLAVGDLGFQRKCLGKINDVTQQGRTVLFVSHNLDAVQRLCSRAMLLESGTLVGYDTTVTILQQYVSSTNRRANAGESIDLSAADRSGSGEVRFTALRYCNPGGMELQPNTGGPVEFEMTLESDSARTVSSLAVVVTTPSGTRLINADTILIDRTLALRAGKNRVRMRITALHLNPGLYRVGLWVADPIAANRGRGPYDFIEAACEMEIASPSDWTLTLPPNAIVACDFEVLESGPVL